jgi:chromosome transmission fidelity protein 18
VELTARSSSKPSSFTENDEPADGYLETKQTEPEDEEKVTKRPKNKAAAARRALCRPIICVCNNLYAPALKPLRQVAEVVHIRRPGAVDLAKRLRTICESEGFKIDNRSLADLCDLMEGDVRACLHALQFMSTTRTQLTTAAEVARNLSQGLKDIGRSEIALTQRIFQQRGRQDIGTRQHELELMLRQASSDLDRIIESCHELFLHTRFFDDSQMTKINTMYDWFLAGDIWAGSRHEWSLMGYSLYVPVRASQLFSSPSYTSNASYSSQVWKYKNLERRNQDLVRDYARSIACCTLTGRTWALLERAPLLLQIIRPSIRSPNPQLLKPSEKLALSRLVQIMANENLSYLEERLEDGTYRMTMDPPIDILTGFSSAPQNISAHETAVRKLIAQQVRQERIRRAQPAASTDKQQQSPSTVPTKRKELPMPKKAVKKDFFGRIISVIEDDLPGTDASKPVIMKPAISYRFNEGFSNAVRRTIRIKELFPLV